MNINVRPATNEDIVAIVNYWANSSDEHLKAMGVDVNKKVAPEVLTERLQHQFSLPNDQKMAYALIWECDGQSIGHCNLNPIEFGERANMHLHIWGSNLRKAGLGQQLVKRSLSYFFDEFHLKKLYCEPYALNPAPNRTLKKVGFEWVKDYITIPGSINFEQEVSQWVMTKDAYLNLK